MEAATVFLAVRPRSVAETRRRLRHLGYPPSLSDDVIDRLVELGYLDDVAFARAWVESRDRARPRGSLALRQELQRKGVPRDTIEEILMARAEAMIPASGSDDTAEALDAEMEAARRLLGRRAMALRRELDPRRRRHRAYALLARNGFAPDVSQRAATAFVDATPESDDEGV
jgi:regulatory protein